MPRYPESIESAIRSYVRDMERKGGYSPTTISDTIRSSRVAFAIVEKFQEGAIPRNVTADTLRRTLEYLRENYAVATQRSYFYYLKELMKASDNRAYEDIRVIYPTDIRPNVDWLSLDDATALLRADLPPLDRIIVVLGLCHGLRRGEIANLHVNDIHYNEKYITVLGKGRGGGKLRSVHFHPIFHTVFLDWMETRTALAQKYREDLSGNALLVYGKGAKLKGYTRESLADFVRRLSERLGISFSCHTLRRTFGREMYHSGVKIETIARIMGHSSTEMTLKYIGINLDDQAVAMNQFILR